MAKSNGGNSSLEVQLRAAKERIQILSVRIQQMTDQHKNENMRQQEIITALRHAESSARTLCTIILSKDRGEMRLGTNYNWNSLGTEDLIKKAIESYRAYCSERTQNLQKIKDYAMDKVRKLEDAQMEIDQLREEQRRELRKSDSEAIKAQRTVASASAIQRGASEVFRASIDKIQSTTGSLNNVDVILDDDDVAEAMPVVKGVLKEKDRAMVDAAINRPVMVAMSKKAVAEINKAVKEAQQDGDEILAGMLEKLDDIQWTIIRVIGDTGLSLVRDIAIEVEKDKNYPYNQVNAKINDLGKMNIVNIHSQSFAGTPNARLVKLATLGVKAYAIRFKKTPVPAEMDIIKAEHASYAHGYSIRACYNLFKTAPQLSSLNMFTRKRLAMESGDGTTYIPDIAGIYKEKPIYFEYETGTQEDANVLLPKLDKMVFHTQEFNFISPGRGGTAKVQNAIYNWVQSRRDKPFMQNITIRFTTFEHLKQAISSQQPFDAWWSTCCPALKFTKPSAKEN